MFDKDEKKVIICAKGKIYKYYQPTDFEDQCGICLWVESELKERVPIKGNISFFSYG